MIAFIDQSRRERMRRALTADAELRRVASGAGALSLALGDTLREIFEADLLGQLCFTREKDYMRERLGLSPRTGYQFLRLAKETRGKDLLRRAVLCGAITPNKALAIARVCSIEMESAWVGLAMEVPLAELVKRVKEFGGEPVPDEAPGGRMFVPMTGEERAAFFPGPVVVGLAADDRGRVRGRCSGDTGNFSTCQWPARHRDSDAGRAGRG